MMQRLAAPLRWAVIAGLLAVRSNALAVPPATGASAADHLADTLAAHQAVAQTPTGSTVKAPTKDRSATVSVLDVAAKLALLVLAVYGVAYGLKVAQQSGFPIRAMSHGATTRRLRAVEELPLRAGVALHLIEVDAQPLVVATAPGGVVSVVMEAAAEAAPDTDAAAPAPAGAETAAGMSFLRDDADWQTRRDALIRALSSSTT